MNVQPPTPETTLPSASTAVEALPPSTTEIDRSCCLPVTMLFTSGVIWLFIGLVLGLISSIKLHAAGFLAGAEWLTYGRIYPASLNALIYGFATPSALAITLWLFARLGRTTLGCANAIAAGALFWNVGVVLGIGGILAGHNTGYQWLEMPRYASPILFAAYLIIGLCAMTSFHLRRERSLYVSQWYLLAALLWFPWIYSTAQLLLVFAPVRGAFQAVINGWFAHNLFGMWLTPVGLAAVFYFIPKILGRPLYSQYLAMFGFWTLALFGAWGGVHAGAPVPKWLSSMSIVAAVMTVVPMLAVAWNYHRTIAGDYGAIKASPVLRFIGFGAASYFLATGLEIASSFRVVSAVTLFTLYETGVTQLHLFGFIGMIVAGSIYYILPRVTQSEWPAPKLIQWHFWLMAVGVVISVLALLIGGVIQGVRINNPEVPFINIVRSTIPFLGLGTLGSLLLLAANGALLVNLAKLLRAACPSCGQPVNRTGHKTAAVGANL